MLRIGHGYDVHRLVPNRKLVLGGIEVPHPLGLLGHSDADVLLHAICDAILGAVAEGDLGRHFPDTDPAYRGADSRKLLAEVLNIARKRQYLVNNIDATIIAQRPRLAPYIRQMVETIAATCEVDIRRVNIKATTTETLGFAGREEGIAAHAVVLMKHYDPNDSER